MSPPVETRRILVALSASLSAFCVGILIGWTSPVSASIRDGKLGFDVSAEELSWVAAIMPLGAALACMCTILPIMGKVGYRIPMLVMVLPFVAGFALMAFAINVFMLCLGRFIGGFAAGAYSVLMPTYVGEIATNKLRPVLACLFPVSLVFGILFAYVVGVFSPYLVFTAICMCWPIIFGIIFFFMPESPVFLIAQGKDDEAAKSLKFLRGRDQDIENDVEDTKEDDSEDDGRDEDNEVEEKPKRSKVESLSNLECRKALLLSATLMFLQQFSGINCVLFYATSVLSAAGAEQTDWATVGAGIVLISGIIIAVLLVNRIGRRILLVISSGLMCLALFTLGQYFFKIQTGRIWVPLLSIYVYLLAFALGFGLIPWLVMAEICAPDAKALGRAITGFCHWIFAYIVTKTFQNLLDVVGQGPPCWLYGGITFLGIFFVVFFTPGGSGSIFGDSNNANENDSAAAKKKKKKKKKTAKK